jgi:hypothetical protein
MGIIERIFNFIDYKKISVNEFSKKVDVSNGYFAKQRLSNANVGSQIIEKIINTYPDISIEWLVIGKGEMLKPEARPVPVREPDKSALEMIWELSAENALLKREIEEMRKEKKNKAAALAVLDAK